MIVATRTITSHDVQSHYDELDDLYRQLWGQHLHHGLWIHGNESKVTATQQLIDRISEVGSFTAEARICDIGCGYGATSQVLAETWNAQVNGVTITPSQFEIAKKLSPTRGQVKFHLEDWLHNSLPSSFFDHAIAIESSEHAVDKSQYFHQAYRVLKPQGNITFCAWMANESAGAWEKKHLLTPICNEGRLPSLLTESNYLKTLQDCGFEITYVEDLTHKVKKTWTLVLVEMLKYLFTSPVKFLGLLKNLPKNRDFFWTPLRMRWAYETGALRYVLVSAKK